MNKSVLALICLTFVAGCVSFPGSLAEFKLFPTKTISLVEDLSINAEAAPDAILENKKTTIFFEAENRGNTTLRDVALTLTDTCILNPTNAAAVTKNLGTMQPKDIRGHEVELQARAVDLQQPCEVRYKTTYSSTATLLSDVAVVSEAELTRLNRRGAESDLRIFEVETRGPLDLDLTFSKDQPIPEATSFFVYVQLFNKGGGEIDAIAPNTLRLTYPTDVVELDSAGCDDLRSSGGTLTNPGEVKFFNKETKRIACKFRTRTGGIISNVGTFRVDVTYTYVLRNSVTVVVNPE